MGKCRENDRKPQRCGRVVTIGRTEDIPPGRGATIKLKDGSEVAVVNRGGNFHAMENFCPHKGYPLADSEVDGNAIECRFHGWKFDVRTGECLTKKRCGIEVYEIEVENGRLKLRL